MAILQTFLSHTRNAKAAKRFLSKALKNYNNAITQLKSKNDYSHIKHSKVKYLNNIIESLNRLIKTMLGFKSMKTANATIPKY